MSHFVSLCATLPSKIRPLFNYRLAVLFAAVAFLLQGRQYSRALDDLATHTDTAPAHVTQGHPTQNRITFQNGSHLDFLGVFTPDTKFHKPSKLSEFAGSAQTGGVRATQQRVAPPRMLHSYEQTTASFAPPNHAIALTETESLPHRALSGLSTLAYGHLNVLQAPNHVTTDSRGRVIVSDPVATAVHVIDPLRKSSFRIVAGPGKRVEVPGDIAVDANDNIYIVDSSRAIVQVYDPYGRFLRQIGVFRGENMYQQLTGIAINRTAGHLYLADGPRHMVFMLDLDGNVLRSMGKYSSRGSPGELQRREKFGPEAFDYPQDIAVGDHDVAVLDKSGTRVQILDLDCNPIASFSVQHAAQDEGYSVGIDKDRQIYVSYSRNSEIRIFNRQGKIVGSLRHTGPKANQFIIPMGLWIDGQNRMYVVDELNAQVQLYQVENAADNVGSSSRESTHSTPEVRMGE